MNNQMNKNDAAILIYAQLIQTHLSDGRIAHLKRGQRASAIADLAVHYATILDTSFIKRDNDEATFAKNLRELWRLDEK